MPLNLLSWVCSVTSNSVKGTGMSWETVAVVRQKIIHTRIGSSSEDKENEIFTN